MSVISKELEATLEAAFASAQQQRYEYMTIEQLLLHLLDNASAAESLRACVAANVLNGNCTDDNAGDAIDKLRKDLQEFIVDNTPKVAGTGKVESVPSLGFQRCVQRAIMQVQQIWGDNKVVEGANVLVAIFGEKDSHAVYYLHRYDVTRTDVVDYVKGTTKEARQEVERKLDQHVSCIQFFMKMKDGEPDPNFLKILKAFQLKLKKQGLVISQESDSLPPKAVKDFLLSDRNVSFSYGLNVKLKTV